MRLGQPIFSLQGQHQGSTGETFEFFGFDGAPAAEGVVLQSTQL
jgi:hypothetical protein